MKFWLEYGIGNLLLLLAVGLSAAVGTGTVYASDGEIPEAGTKIETRGTGTRGTETRGTETRGSAQNAEFQTVTVPDDARTLGEAYAMTAEGGTIEIRAGIYEVNEPLTIGKNLTLRGLGEKPEDVLLAGREQNVLYVKSGLVRVQNLSIRNEGGVRMIPNGPESKKEKKARLLFNARHAAVRVAADRGFFEKCVLGSSEGCCVLAYGEEVRLNFDECVIEKSHIGIVLKNGVQSEFNACTFWSNSLIDLQLGEGGRGVLKNCLFSDSTTESLLLRDTGELEVRNCDFQRCSSGIGLTGKGSNAKIFDSRFTECGVGVKLLDRASATLTQCRFERNKTAGLNAMQNSKVEVVFCIFQAQEIFGMLHSGGAKGKIRDCRFLQNQACGLYITKKGTQLQAEHCDFTDQGEMGTVVSENARGTFRDCVFQRCGGTGLTAEAGAYALAADCTMESNAAYGIAVIDGASGIFRENKLTGNGQDWFLRDEKKIQRTGNDPNE